ncbi:response regulator transcription factor [Methylobacterium sp. A54F]
MTAVMEMTPRTKRAAPRKQDTLLVIDDHPVIFEGFRRLAKDIGIANVLEASDIVTGYAVFHSHKPRLVVTDLYFEEDGLSGLTLIRQMRASNPASHILVFSETDDPIIIAHALKVGARGFALKHSPITTLLEALATVQAGRGYLPHEIATKIAMLDTRERLKPFANLTPRELQILSLIGRGRSYDEIAAILPIKYRRLISVTSKIRVKLGVETLVDLIQVAQSHIELRV